MTSFASFTTFELSSLDAGVRCLWNIASFHSQASPSLPVFPMLSTIISRVFIYCCIVWSCLVFHACLPCLYIWYLHCICCAYTVDRSVSFVTLREYYANSVFTFQHKILSRACCLRALQQLQTVLSLCLCATTLEPVWFSLYDPQGRKVLVIHRHSKYAYSHSLRICGLLHD